ncbi:MAG TPA: helix-turn-helix domain-containing protein [Trebonia sp.]|jgi:DNA-binding transcriptional ArsR family regulator
MTTPDQPPRRLLNPEALRLLAQPVRLRIQAQLQHGPANATTLARALGESTGLTSHHLRQLAKHGFIEEVPELARGRERWWRPARVDWRVPPREEQDPEMRALMDEILRLELAADLRGFASAQFEQDNAAGEPWVDQLPYSRGLIYVTAGELKEFFEEYIKLVNRYHPPAGQVRAGTRPVVTSFMAYPSPPAGEER